MFKRIAAYFRRRSRIRAEFRKLNADPTLMRCDCGCNAFVQKP